MTRRRVRDPFPHATMPRDEDSRTIRVRHASILMRLNESTLRNNSYWYISSQDTEDKWRRRQTKGGKELPASLSRGRAWLWQQDAVGTTSCEFSPSSSGLVSIHGRSFIGVYAL